MDHKKKIEWMAVWAAKNNLKLDLQGECGIGRECVGISTDGVYPDYEWHDDKTYERIDDNGEVWTPEDAYHKHPCVAVLGRGEAAETQLYDWLKWFDDNGFVLENTAANPATYQHLGPMAMLLGKHRNVRLVRK